MSNAALARRGPELENPGKSVRKGAIKITSELPYEGLGVVPNGLAQHPERVRRVRGHFSLFVLMTGIEHNVGLQAPQHPMNTQKHYDALRRANHPRSV